ncbi:MAG: Lrp/AsnC family transcriptional regulator [Dehalococcoidia bacterium]|nr:Lrp/AsnC family transcriptional regulator [Dehalococcoidia bacterium]
MVRSNFDALDWAIVSELSRNARLSTRKIASRLPLSEATVRRRLKRLVDADAVSLKALVDPAFLGLNIEAIIGLSVRMDRVSKVVEALRKLDNVVYVAVVSGRFDITLLGVFHSVDDLLQFMESEVGQLEGVKGTETLVCLKVEKGRHVFLGGEAENRAYPKDQSRKPRAQKALMVSKAAAKPATKVSAKPAIKASTKPSKGTKSAR